MDNKVKKEEKDWEKGSSEELMTGVFQIVERQQIRIQEDHHC